MSREKNNKTQTKAVKFPVVSRCWGLVCVVRLSEGAGGGLGEGAAGKGGERCDIYWCSEGGLWCTRDLFVWRGMMGWLRGGIIFFICGREGEGRREREGMGHFVCFGNYSSRCDSVFHRLNVTETLKFPLIKDNINDENNNVVGISVQLWIVFVLVSRSL